MGIELEQLFAPKEAEHSRFFDELTRFFYEKAFPGRLFTFSYRLLDFSRQAVGCRNFDRRFIKPTGNTPVEYAQRVKIESAKRAFETNRKAINEVMFEVGYSDVKAFREVFRKITGMLPLEYKLRFNKMQALA